MPEPCPEATSNPIRGSDSIAACIVCEPGTANSERGRPQCTDCEVGRTSAGNQTACNLCLQGKFADDIGMSECTICPDIQRMTTVAQGSRKIDDCVCKESYMMMFDGRQKQCMKCPRHMHCPMSSEYTFNSSGVPAQHSFDYALLPRIKKGYMVFKQDYLRGYKCKSDDCPGTVHCEAEFGKIPLESCMGLRNLVGVGSMCTSPLRTGVACGRCQENYIPLRGECVQCTEVKDMTLEGLGILIVTLPVALLGLCGCSPLKGVCGGCGDGCGDFNAACGVKSCSASSCKLNCDAGCWAQLSMCGAALCAPLLKILTVVSKSGNKLFAAIGKRKEETAQMVELLLPFAQIIGFVNMLSIDQPEAVEESANAASHVDMFSIMESMKIPCFLAGKGGLNGPRRMLVSILTPLTLFFIMHLVLLIPLKTQNFMVEKTGFKPTWGSILNVFFLVMNVFYVKLLVVCLAVLSYYYHPKHPETGFIESSLIGFPNVLFKEDPDNKLVSMDIVEGTSMLKSMIGYSIFGIIIYVISFAVLLGFIAKRAPYYYAHPNIKVRKFFREATGFAIKKYRPDRWWWCCMVLYRNVAVSLTTVAVESAHLQLLWLSCSLSIYLACQFYAWPWKWVSGNWMDAICTGVLLLYFTGSGFYINSSETDIDEGSYCADVRHCTGLVIGAAIWLPAFLFIVMTIVSFKKEHGRISHIGQKLQLGYEFVQIMDVVLQQPQHAVNTMMQRLTESDRMTLQNAMDIFVTEMLGFQPGESIAGQNFVRRLLAPSRKRVIQSIIDSDKDGLKNVEFNEMTPADAVSLFRKEGRLKLQKSIDVDVFQSKASKRARKYLSLEDEASRLELSRILLFNKPPEKDADLKKAYTKIGATESRGDSILLNQFRKRLAEMADEDETVTEANKVQPKRPSHRASTAGRSSKALIGLYEKALINASAATAQPGKDLKEAPVDISIDEDHFSRLFANIMSDFEYTEDQVERIFHFLDIDNDMVINADDVSIALESLRMGWMEEVQQVHDMAKHCAKKWMEKTFRDKKATVPPQQSMAVVHPVIPTVPGTLPEPENEESPAVRDAGQQPVVIQVREKASELKEKANDFKEKVQQQLDRSGAE
eukprot:gnl/MRDRNA2_/MRDRNA2_15734_c0_seq1.p1 gnl/MRDRNA2_/MRDRNA2_15734_c0~~gnl/MRDRNA2_/MRDRNA2_15734_c0_seq1.p1  ORF type:complete len:1115 (+),score=177.72 gnl/MRDRNA2_/MRDRNA2_15734_c0_seq1:28-3345(+)